MAAKAKPCAALNCTSTRSKAIFCPTHYAEYKHAPSTTKSPLASVSYSNPNTDVVEVVCHPLGLDYYLQFSKTDFSDENLKFWVEVNNLKRMEEKKQLARARALHAEYLKEGVSLDHKTLEAVNKYITSGELPLLMTALTRVQHQIIALCRLDHFRRFKETAFWREFVAAVSAWNNSFPELLPLTLPPPPAMGAALTGSGNTNLSSGSGTGSAAASPTHKPPPLIQTKSMEKPPAYQPNSPAPAYQSPTAATHALAPGPGVPAGSQLVAILMTNTINAGAPPPLPTQPMPPLPSRDSSIMPIPPLPSTDTMPPLPDTPEVAAANPMSPPPVYTAAPSAFQFNQSAAAAAPTPTPPPARIASPAPIPEEHVPHSAKDLLADLGLDDGSATPVASSKPKSSSSGKSSSSSSSSKHHSSSGSHKSSSSGKTSSSSSGKSSSSSSSKHHSSSKHTSSSSEKQHHAAANALLADIGLDDGSDAAPEANNAADLLKQAGLLDDVTSILPDGEHKTKARSKRLSSLKAYQINLTDDGKPTVQCAPHAAKHAAACCKHKSLECLAARCKHDQRYGFCCRVRKTLHTELDLFVKEQEEIIHAAAHRQSSRVHAVRAQAARNDALVEKSFTAAAAAPAKPKPTATTTATAPKPAAAAAASKPDSKQSSGHARRPSLLTDADHEMLDVLNHPVGLEHVIRFLSGEHREEHIRFWVRARDFRMHPTPERAKSIFNDYVAAGAKQRVEGLDAIVVQKLKVCVDKQLAGNTMLWMAKAQRNVEVHLRNDAFRRFKTTGGAWNDCVAEMNDFNKKFPDLVPHSAATMMERLNKVVAAYGPTTELLDVIMHPLGCEYFGHFMKSDFSEENIKFWMRVQEFKTVHPPSKQIDCAKDIYNTFLKPNATQQVSIDSKSLILLTKAIDNGVLDFIKLSLLRAQKEIVSLMRSDHYPRFKSHALWAEFCVEVIDFNQRLPEVVPSPYSEREADDVAEQKARRLEYAKICKYDANTDLIEIICHPIGIDYFSRFLKSEHNEENISFFAQLRNFQKVDSSKQVEVARSLFAEYLKPNAPNAVSLDAAVTSMIAKAVEGGVIQFITLAFKRAQKEIVGLMRAESYRRFKDSALWKDFCREGSEFNTRFPEMVTAPAEVKEELGLPAGSERVVSVAGGGGGGSVGGNEDKQRADNLMQTDYDDDTEMQDVINHPLGVEYLTRYMITDFSAENIKFWTEINNFNALEPASKLSTARAIFNEFVTPQSPSMVNLDSATLSMVTKAMTANTIDAITPAFARAQTEIFNLMNSDSYRRFKKSALWKEFIREAIQFNHRFPELVPAPTPTLANINKRYRHRASLMAGGGGHARNDSNATAQLAALLAAKAAAAPVIPPVGAPLPAVATPSPRHDGSIDAGKAKAPVEPASPLSPTTTAGAALLAAAAAQAAQSASPTTTAGVVAAPKSEEKQPVQAPGSNSGGMLVYVGTCVSVGCGKPASVGPCPVCTEMKLPPAYFCSQECFTSSWADHCKKHEKQIVRCSHPDNYVCCRHKHRACLVGRCSTHLCCKKRAQLHPELNARYSSLSSSRSSSSSSLSSSAGGGERSSSANVHAYVSKSTPAAAAAASGDAQPALARPASNVALASSIPPSPAGWVEALDKRSGKLYYANHKTKASAWTIPPEYKAHRDAILAATAPKVAPTPAAPTAVPAKVPTPEPVTAAAAPAATPVAVVAPVAVAQPVVAAAPAPAMPALPPLPALPDDAVLAAASSASAAPPLAGAFAPAFAPVIAAAIGIASAAAAEGAGAEGMPAVVPVSSLMHSAASKPAAAPAATPAVSSNGIQWSAPPSDEGEDGAPPPPPARSDSVTSSRSSAVLAAAAIPDSPAMRGASSSVASYAPPPPPGQPRDSVTSLMSGTSVSGPPPPPPATATTPPSGAAAAPVVVAAPLSTSGSAASTIADKDAYIAALEAKLKALEAAGVKA